MSDYQPWVLLILSCSNDEVACPFAMRFYTNLAAVKASEFFEKQTAVVYTGIIYDDPEVDE